MVLHVGKDNMATYDSKFYKTPQESMYEYMQRLASQRAKGILGGGAMFDTTAVDPVTNEITDTELGVVVQKCPTGYYWNERQQACVRQDSDNGNESQLPRTQQQKVQDAADLLSGRGLKASTAVGLLPIPFASAIGKVLDPIQRARAIEIAKADLIAGGMTPEEADRVLEGAEDYEAERYAAMHGQGLSGTAPRYDYIPDSGLLTNVGSRTWSDIARGGMGPVSAAALDTTTPNPYNSLVASIMGQDPSTIRSAGMAFGPYQNIGSYTRNPITGQVEYTPAQTAQGMFGTYTPNYNFDVSNYTSNQGVIGAHNLVSEAEFNRAMLEDYGNQSRGTPRGGVTVTTMDGTTYGGGYTDSFGDTYNDGFGSDFDSDWDSATSGS